jgi:cytochrome c oxidase assembly factor CtaG
VLKFLLVMAMAPLHVLLGIPIMMMQDILASDYYLELGRTWGPSLAADQYTGGTILWAFGDVSAGLLVVAFMRQWYRSDERDARRTDRHLDRIYGTGPTITPWWLAGTSDDEVRKAHQADTHSRSGGDGG